MPEFRNEIEGWSEVYSLRASRMRALSLAQQAERMRKILAHGGYIGQRQVTHDDLSALLLAIQNELAAVK